MADFVGGEPGIQKAKLFAGERQAIDGLAGLASKDGCRAVSYTGIQKAKLFSFDRQGEADKRKAQLFAAERPAKDGWAGISHQGRLLGGISKGKSCIQGWLLDTLRPSGCQF